MSPSPVKPEWQRALITLSGVVVVTSVVAILWWARPIVIPLALAVFFAFVLSPLVMWLQRRGFGRLPAVLVVAVLTLAVLGSAGWVVGLHLSTLPDHVEKHAENIKQRVKTVRELVNTDDSRFGALLEDLFSHKTAHDPNGPTPVVLSPGSSAASEWLRGLVSPALDLMTHAFLVGILVVFILLKREDLRNRVIRLIGHGGVTTTTKAIDDATQRLSRYLLMQFVLNVGFGIAVALALMLIGVDYAVLWGFLSAVLRYIPYIGSWLSLVFPLVFSIATGDGWWQPIAVVVIIAGLEQVCGSVLEPWLYGHSLGVSAVAQLVSAAFWAFLWGPVGLVLSGPLTVCLLVVGKYVPRLNWLAVLLSDEAPLDAHVMLYQRLTAHDQDEAEAIVAAEIKKTSVEAAFDTVVLPALALAKYDLERGQLETHEEARVAHMVDEIVEELCDTAFPAAVHRDEPESRVRLLLHPAGGELDLGALKMLGRMLNSEKWEVAFTGAGAVSSELLAQIEELEPSAVCMASLPPGGLTHMRSLIKRLRRVHPTLQILIGRWTQTADEAQDQALVEAGANRVESSLLGMRQHLQSWEAVFAEGEQTAAKEAGLAAVAVR